MLWWRNYKYYTMQIFERNRHETKTFATPEAEASYREWSLSYLIFYHQGVAMAQFLFLYLPFIFIPILPTIKTIVDLISRKPLTEEKKEALDKSIDALTTQDIQVKLQNLYLRHRDVRMGELTACPLYERPISIRSRNLRQHMRDLNEKYNQIKYERVVELNKLNEIEIKASVEVTALVRDGKAEGAKLKTQQVDNSKYTAIAEINARYEAKLDALLPIYKEKLKLYVNDSENNGKKTYTTMYNFFVQEESATTQYGTATTTTTTRAALS